MIARENITDFIDTAPIDGAFRAFIAEAVAASPSGYDDSLIILSNRSDTAAGFRHYGRGAWRLFFETLPDVPVSDRIAEAREMIAWMFAEGAADLIFALACPGDEAAAAFSTALGARTVLTEGDGVIVEIAKVAH